MTLLNHFAFPDVSGARASSGNVSLLLRFTTLGGVRSRALCKSRLEEQLGEFVRSQRLAERHELHLPL